MYKELCVSLLNVTATLTLIENAVITQNSEFLLVLWKLSCQHSSVWSFLSYFLFYFISFFPPSESKSSLQHLGNIIAMVTATMHCTQQSFGASCLQEAEFDPLPCRSALVKATLLAQNEHNKKRNRPEQETRAGVSEEPELFETRELFRSVKEAVFLFVWGVLNVGIQLLLPSSEQRHKYMQFM